MLHSQSLNTPSVSRSRNTNLSQSNWSLTNMLSKSFERFTCTNTTPIKIFSHVYNQIQTTSATSYKFFSCHIKCCVDQFIAKVSDTDCSCNSKQIKDALFVWMVYMSMCKSAACGNVTNANNLLDKLNKLCVTTNCGCS